MQSLCLFCLFYVPSGDHLKTLPVKCQSYKYEQFKPAHTVVVMSFFDQENDNGEKQTYEFPTAQDTLSTNRFLGPREEFLAFVQERNPKLADQAELKTLEFTNSEIARLLDQPTSTITSRGEKLKALMTAFIDTVIIP